MNDGLALDIAMLLFRTGYVGIGLTDSWAGLQMFPLQLAYRHGEGMVCGGSLLAVGALGFGFGFGSPLLCWRTLARLFLNHTCLKKEMK